MYAIIKSGGKQYKVANGDTLQVEKLDGAAGDKVTLSDVLATNDGKSTTVGAPLVSGATVNAEIIEQGRADKVIIFKKKRRHNYRRKLGHRQPLTTLLITDVTGKGAAAPKKAAPKKTAEKPAAEKKAAAPKKEAAAKKPAATKADDLGLISGIGPKYKKELAELGFTSFKQIAEISAEKIAEVEEKLNCSGRFEREEWVEQAKELLDGKAPRAKTDQAAAKKADKE